MFTEPENLDWRFEAKCANDEHLQDQIYMIRKYGTDDPFFPEKGKGKETQMWAKRYCSDCPVRLACLAEAMKSLDYIVYDQYQGIWGGLNSNSRKKLKARQEERNRQLLQQVQELFPGAASTRISDEEDDMDETQRPAS